MSEFVNYLHEIFEQFGPIRSRKMFGVEGIYHNDLIFAIVDDDELFLKADDKSALEFEQLGLDRYEYRYRTGKTNAELYYFAAPADIYEDSSAAAHWAGLAYDAALRGNKKK